MRRLAMIKEKIKRYRAFWSKEPVERPMIGFSLGGWFQLKNYSALEKLRGRPRLEADQLSPEDFFPDYDRIVNFQWMRSKTTSSAPLPPSLPSPGWKPCSAAPSKSEKSLSGSTREDSNTPVLIRIDLSPRNPWRLKYLEFVLGVERSLWRTLSCRPANSQGSFRHGSGPSRGFPHGPRPLRSARGLRAPGTVIQRFDHRSRPRAAGRFRALSQTAMW